MLEQPLAQVLILLAGSLFVVTSLRRVGLPPILGYLVVGMALGPFAFGLVSDSPTTGLLAELGVTFLLFTLGLEFSLPRMLAMKREVFGLGALQVVATTIVFAMPIPPTSSAIAVRPRARPDSAESVVSRASARSLSGETKT